MKPSEVRKVLILRFSSLGDIIMATAMVRNVRRAFPRAQIDMVVRADFLDLIRHNPHLDKKIGLPRSSGVSGLLKLIREINREHYDLIYDAHRSLRTRVMVPFLKAGHKAYFKKHYLRRSLALTFKLRILSNKRMLETYIDPLTPYGVAYDGLGPEIFVDEETQIRTAGKAAWQFSGDWIGVVPSAQWPGKRWPLSRFRELLEKLVAKTPARIVVLGGKEDTFCAALCAGLPTDRVWNAQGKFSIAESAALLSHCRLVVANDTGLMHVADALAVPSVLMLGPTSREMGCLPFHAQAQILEKAMWCRPCSKNGQAPCIRGKRHCLEDITSDEVLTRTLKLWEAR